MVEESKSALKREVEALQQLAIAVSRLSEKEIGQLNLPDSLEKAIIEYKRMKSHGAMRRQAQYLGRLMREADPEATTRMSTYIKQRQ